MRTQAVLVLFLLSDSPDLTPPAVPTDDFIQIVQDAKAECGGDVCVVTSGAIAGACYDQPGNTNTRLYDFMNGFGKPPASWISLEFGMMPNFESVLGDALADECWDVRRFGEILLDNPAFRDTLVVLSRRRRCVSRRLVWFELAALVVVIALAMVITVRIARNLERRLTVGRVLRWSVKAVGLVIHAAAAVPVDPHKSLSEV